MMRLCGRLVCRVLWFGNLNDRSNTGLRCVNANNGVTTARWNILLRHSIMIKMSNIFCIMQSARKRKLIETAPQC